MIINWVTKKTRQFFAESVDEPSVNFDFALSADMMSLLLAQNDVFLNEEDGSEAIQEESVLQELDEYELALA
jgi:hypothetical protein